MWNKKRAKIVFKAAARGKYLRHIEGHAVELMNLLLNGIEGMCFDPAMRRAFKEGIEQVYANWDAEEKGAAE